VTLGEGLGKGTSEQSNELRVMGGEFLKWFDATSFVGRSANKRGGKGK